MRGRRIGRLPFLPTMISGFIIKEVPLTMSTKDTVRCGLVQVKSHAMLCKSTRTSGVVGNSTEIIVPGAAGISARSTSSLGS